MDAITFEIPGPAIPQPRAHPGRFAGKMFTSPKNGIKTFRQAVAIVARNEARRAGWSHGEGWFTVDVESIFSRPAGHLTKSGKLSSTALPFPGKRQGDCANFVRGICDTITKAQCIWLDDSRVVDERSRKRYAERGEPERTVITIRRVA